MTEWSVCPECGDELAPFPVAIPLDHERVLIGAVLMSSAAYLAASVEGVCAYHFRNGDLATVWEAVEALNEAGDEVDPATLRLRLIDQGAPEPGEDWATYLMETMVECPSVLHAWCYARTIVNRRL